MASVLSMLSAVNRSGPRSVADQGGGGGAQQLTDQLLGSCGAGGSPQSLTAWLIALGLAGHYEPERDGIYIGTHIWRVTDDGAAGRRLSLGGQSGEPHKAEAANLAKLFTTNEFVTLWHGHRWVLDGADFEDIGASVRSTWVEHRSGTSHVQRFYAAGHVMPTTDIVAVAQDEPASAAFARFVPGVPYRHIAPRLIDWREDEFVINVNTDAGEGDKLTYAALYLDGVSMTRTRWEQVRQGLDVRGNALALAAQPRGTLRALVAYLLG